jgi:transcriptional regulator with XRE-family HTH domain
LPFCKLRLKGSRPPDFSISYAREPKTLGEHLRKQRLYRGLRQRDLAQIIGVREETVARWEKDRGRPLVRLYPAIIAFIGSDPDRVDGSSPASCLRALRRRLGLTQAELATRLGLGEGTVTEFELERRKVSPKVRQSIAAFMRERGGS